MIKSIVQYLLAWLSKKIIKKYRPDIIGITGSIGKTSVKEAIFTVLSIKFLVRKSNKNYNNEFGVPLTIIGIEKSPCRSWLGWLFVLGKAVHLICVRDKNYPEILVLEMGADKPGDIEYLTDIAPCKVGVLTFISHAHTEFFKTIKKIAQEKRIIISRLRQDGFAVLNFDSNLVMQQSSMTKAEIVTYGFKKGADLQATDLKILVDENDNWPTGLNFKILYKGNVIPLFLNGSIAKPMVSATLAGLSVGTIFGINIVEGAQAFANFKALSGHLTLISGIKKTLIIDDTYNSSPDPTKVALELLNEIKIKDNSSKYAVLADMLELGEETENAHREIGFKVAEVGVDYLITVGEASKQTAKAALEAGISKDNIYKFSNAISAGKFLQEKIAEGDLILIKGSQSLRMEKVVKEIMANPLSAKKLLVRQEEYWD